MLVMHGLQLKEVKEDSDEYGKMMKAIEAISKLPGTVRLCWGNVRYPGMSGHVKICQIQNQFEQFEH